MYLRELKLQGFKSFADLTRLELQRGVTAIVGPNGCGKSNIADAIRWVLGEQSAKSLRAGAMQDVIFQGAAGRKPVNLCEVSLVFAECEDRLGMAYNEVEITRRVVRDGGSDYYINGKACRLKDIQRLFLDTGVGQVSYSFMLQGQIDQILSSNPSERRAIFEEAAGISKYKAQRREALGKLAQVDANLARVTDVIEEINRQMGSLRRQAAKALRYKRIRHRLTYLELASGAYRHGQIRAMVEKLENTTRFLQAEAAKVEKELQEGEAGLTGKRADRNALREQMQAVQNQIYALRSDKENAENRAEFAVVRKNDLQGRLTAIGEELERLTAEERALADKVAGEAEVKRSQMELFGDSDAVFQEKSSELSELQQQLSAAEADYARTRNATEVREGSLSRLRSNCTALELELQTYQVRHANLADEIKGLSDRGASLGEELGALVQAATDREATRTEQEFKVEEHKQAVRQLTGQYRDCQATVQGMERELAGLRAQIQVLEGLQERFEGFSEGVKAILKGALEGVLSTAHYMVFLKQVKVASRYTKGLERMLGVAGEGLLLLNDAPLTAVTTALRDRKLGWAGLLVGTGGGADSAVGAPLPRGLTAALDVVSSKDPAVTAFLNSYLAGCYYCENLEAFLEYWRAHPDFEFRMVVSLDGEWVDARGVVVAGKGKDTAASSYLERENQLTAHRAKQAEIEGARDSQREIAEQLQGQIDAAEKRVESQQALLAELVQEVGTLKVQRQGVERARLESIRSLDVKRAEIQKLESGREALEERMRHARSELEATEAAIEAGRKAVADKEAAVVALRERREQLRETFNEIKLEIAEKRQRLAVLDRGLSALEEKAQSVAQTRLQRQAETEAIRTQFEALDRERAERTAEAASIEAKLKQLTEAIEKDRVALQAVERSIDIIEEGFRGKRERYQNMTGELNTQSVELARQQSRLQFIEEELQREYEKAPGEIDWKQMLWQAGESLPERIRVDIEDESPDEMETEQERPAATAEELAALDDTDWAAVDEEAKGLRSRMQSMGPVNLVAIEEYKSLKERHSFLTGQSEDLWKSKEALVGAIDEINATSKALFTQTFEAVRENFKQTFDTLFGGGRSDLALVDNEDVLESGIDIMAQPPGTRLKTLALLSGGQKTMTAVALLFAIYMVKPSPFCVLDEIDAPLDDANIGRFTQMLEGFLDRSQFVIITHNKRTISVADTIYGATMQEKGVSRVISMRFNKNTGKAEVVENAQS